MPGATTSFILFRSVKPIHVLVEISGGVLTNVIAPSNVQVWLRDYDHLESEGITSRQAEAEPPVLFNGKGGTSPPQTFTRPLKNV